MTFRTLRFPILIGGGIVAAAGLVYFSHSRVASEQTLGAIGKRDVYRDGQASSADIGAPGSAPVAVTAILQGKEFNALARNSAFQNPLASHDLQVLARNNAFISLLANTSFQVLATNPAFVQLAQNASFQQGAASVMHQVNAGALQQVKAGAVQQVSAGLVQGLRANLRSDSNFQALRNNAAFNSLLSSAVFLQMAGNQAFAKLLSGAAFQSLIQNQSFVALVNQSEFQNALLQGSAANLSAAVRAQ